MNIHDASLLKRQRAYFFSGATLPIDFRINQLKKLKSLIQSHEAEIIDALKKDLRKCEMEAIVSEIILMTEEIDYHIKHLHRWAQPEEMSTPFPLSLLGRSRIYREPYGSVLIIGPWNYPFSLIMSPLMGAISAGNCVVIKPSEVASHTEKVIVKILSHFSAEYIAVVTGGPSIVENLLTEKWDYIFFTGAASIGKIVMSAAAKHLIPVTLELGGKSPCIVDESADLHFAARRIVWAKTSNAGQVCIAPDYLYVHQSCKEALVNSMIQSIQTFFGKDPLQNPDYGRIINQRHFERLVALLAKGHILYGGQYDQTHLTISPTLIDGLSWDDPIMQEEIFGPLLPIFTFEKMDDIIPLIKAQPKPLSLYLFTKNKINEEKILQHLSFGGGCINDCMLQVANYHLPFGGVGQSGMGQYHGRYSFETFSHQKSIYAKKWLFDFNLEYPPYTEKKLRWLKRMLGIK